MLTRYVLRYRRAIFAFLCMVILVIILSHRQRANISNNHLHHQSSVNEVISDQKPRLAILVPFRDRFDELLAFVPYMHKYLAKQDVGPFKIYILNQSHKYRFNRGALANVGFMLAKEHSEYIAIHDIDLIPINQNLSYAYPEKGPYHLTSPEYHPNYNYEKYFGGILLINNEHFQLVNGFSNRYFGWGLEDDEFYTRVRAAGLPIGRPSGLKTDKNDTFLHFHYGRKRDMTRSRLQSETLRHRDHITGLNNLIYTLTSMHRLTFDDNYDCAVYNIELVCDVEQTPWCLSSHTKRSKSKKTSIPKTVGSLN